MTVTRLDLDAAWLMLRGLDDRLAKLQPAVLAGDPDASRAYLVMSRDRQAVLQTIKEMTAELLRGAGRLR